MMRDYAKVRPKFWTQGTGKRLRGNPNAQIVAAYLMSGPPGHMTGVFYCPVPTLSHETGIPFEGASKALADLAEEGFAYFDPAFDLVWVPNMAREQIGAALKPRDNLIQAICKHLATLGNHPFCLDFVHRYQGAYHLPLEMVGRALVTPFEPPSREGPSNPLPTPFEARDQGSGIRDQRSAAAAARAYAIPLPSSAAQEHGPSAATQSAEGQSKSSALSAANGSPNFTAPPIDHVAPEDVSREWHRVGQPAWNHRGVLSHGYALHRESYGAIASTLNATAAPCESLSALIEYFWLAPTGPIASGRITRPSPYVLAKGVTDDLADALAWKRGEPPHSVSRGTPNGGNGHQPNGSEVSLRADRKPIPPLPVKPREPEPSEAPK